MAESFFDITEYGAVPDGKTLCTKAFEQAVSAAAECGGTVRVPEGTFLTGAVFLKSNMKLYLAEGSVILGTNEESEYPIVESRVAGVEMSWPAALLNVRDAENVVIYGEGCLDGQGEYWWKKYWGEDRKGGMRAAYEKEGLRWAVDYDCFRVRNIQIFRCKNVKLEGFTSRRPGFWNVHLCYSSELLVSGLTICDGMGPSTDGVDIDSCQGVVVEKCKISCNDDSICLKSGRDADGLKVNRVCENVVIRDNLLLEGSGITLGSETSGGIRNVEIKNNRFVGTRNGFRLKSAKTRGGVLENIRVEDLQMENVNSAFSFEFNWNPSYSYCKIPEGYQGEVPEYWHRMAEKVPEKLGIPRARNITVKGVRSVITPEYAMQEEPEAFHICGLEEAPFEDIYFSDMDLQAESFGCIENVTDFTMEGVRVKVGKYR